MKNTSPNTQGLSIIEIMIAIFIFTLGMSAIFLVISSTVGINSYNKNFIIASNLAREQIELVRNIRDSNYKKFQKWDMLNPNSTSYTDTGADKELTAGKYYRIYNNLSSGFPVSIELGNNITDLQTSLEDVTDTLEEEYRVCLNPNKQYVACTNPLGGLVMTPFYKYIEIKNVTEGSLSGPNVSNALKIRSKVYWNQKGIHDTEIDTIITDWKRL